MADGEGAVDSFDVVKDFLVRLGDRDPAAAEVREIAPALKDIYERLMRVRAVAPSVDLSDRMWGLMRMVGLPVKRGRGTSLGNAASFL
jgi:hypothetical protein